MFANLISANLTTRILGRHIEQVTWTKSTMEDAWELIDNDVEEGALIITDKQTAGKGRTGRTWVSHPGKSVTASLILNPNCKANTGGLFPLVVGIAVVKTLCDLGLTANLKWPNDIMVHGKKIGGILCESKVCGTNLIWVVVGLGLNINENNEDLPIDLNTTSFFVETSSTIQRELILANILNHLELLYKKLIENDPIGSLLNNWTAHCNHIGKTIKFEAGNKILEGKFIGVNNDGRAIIRFNGKENVYTSGEIHLIQS